MSQIQKFQDTMLIRKLFINKKLSRLTRSDKIEHNEQDEKPINSRIANKGQDNW